MSAGRQPAETAPKGGRSWEARYLTVLFPNLSLDNPEQIAEE